MTAPDEARQSREERSAHRVYPVTATPHDGAFVRTFVLTMLVAVASLTALNVLADPLGIFGTGLVPRATWDDRDVKARLFAEQREAPELLVLGSSRTMKLDPACASALTGLRAFNFGVSGGRPEDFLAIDQYVQEAGGPPVRRVLLGVEPDIMLDDVPIGIFTRQSARLGKYVRAEGMPPDQVAAGMWGQAATVASVRSLLHQARGREVEAPAVTFRQDGMAFNPRDEEAVRRGTFDQASRVATQVPGIQAVFDGTHRIDPARAALLRRLLVNLRTRGTTVDAFIPPVQPAALHELRGTAYAARLAETEVMLRSFEREGLLRYHATAGDRIGLEAAAWFDAYHPMQPNADRLLATMIGDGRGCAVQ